jgi:hypothetical protein
MADNLSMALAELLRKADAEPDIDTLQIPTLDWARPRPHATQYVRKHAWPRAARRRAFRL